MTSRPPGGEPGAVVRPRTIPALGPPEPVLAPPRPILSPPPPAPPAGDGWGLHELGIVSATAVTATHPGTAPTAPKADEGWADHELGVPGTARPPKAAEPPTPPAASDESAEPDPEPAPTTTPTPGPTPDGADDEPAWDTSIWTDADVADDDVPTAAPQPTDVVDAAPRRLLRANLMVASGTLASRLTGLIRTSMILIVLIKGLNDAYTNANNTPNMIYELILGGILTASLVPLFTEDLEQGDGRSGTSALISASLVALAIVTAIGFLVGPALIYLLATGAPEDRRDAYVSAAVPLSLLFAPQIFFYGLMAVWSAVLNARNRFLAAAWAPVLNNLIVIAVLLKAITMATGDYPSLSDAVADPQILWLLGAGTTLGIAVMALSLYPALRRAGVRLHFSFQPRHPLVRKAVRLSAWTFGYVLANQIAVIVIQILAKPSTSDPTRYTTAFQWFQLPHALLAVSIMVTFQPLLGRADARGDRPAFNEHLLLGFRLIALLIIPAAVGYIALPKGLDARTFVATGALDEVLGLTGIIAAFAVGLPGFSLYLYAFRGFYAMKDTKTPFLINCVENAINIVLAVVFVRWWGVVGLALAFAIAYDVSAVIAMGALLRRTPGFDRRGLLETLAKLALAAAIMGGFVWGTVSLLAPASAGALLGVTIAGILVGIGTYGASIYALGVPGISELAARLPGRGRGRRAAA